MSAADISGGAEPRKEKAEKMKLEGIVRTRFAPSPTGLLHFGNANTALFNWLVARRYGGVVVLRVEDTDLERSEESLEQSILDDLTWLGIDWDEGPVKGGEYGPYHQKQRMEMYRESVEKLLASGAAYRCFCAKERLEEDRNLAMKENRPPHYGGYCRELSADESQGRAAAGERFTVRFRKPEERTIVLPDIIRGDIVFESRELDDFIIVRASGMPIFLLTNTVDDGLMRITYVVRGEDHISNTPKQLLLYEALGMEAPKYLHTAMILGTDRTKLSKRHGAVNVRQFREEGYIAEAMINYLAFLGWNPKDEREIFSLDELKSEFSIEAMSKNPSVFDKKRLHYLNDVWMRRIDPRRVTTMCAEYLAGRGLVADARAAANDGFLDRVVSVVGERLKIVPDIEEQADFFFRDELTYDESGARKHFHGDETIAMYDEARAALDKVEPFNAENIEIALKKFIEETARPVKKVVHPLRLALTGKLMGPGLYEIIELLGRDRMAARLNRATEWIRANKGSE